VTGQIRLQAVWDFVEFIVSQNPASVKLGEVWPSAKVTIMTHMAWTLTPPKRLALSRADWIRFLEDPDLTVIQKQIWVVLQRAAVQFGRVFYSMPTLAKKCGIAVRTAQRACRILEARGWLVITRRQHPAGDPTTHLFEPVVAFRRQAESSPSPTPVADASEPTPPPAITDHHPSVCKENANPPCMPDSPSTAAGDPGIFASQNETPQETSPPGRETWLEWGITAPHKVVNAIIHFDLLPATRVQEWIRRYGINRTAQVISWAVAAPDGAIRSLSAWVETALAQNWEGHNAWIRAWEAARQSRRAAEETAAQLQAEARAAVEAETRHARDLAEWQHIRAELSDGALDALARAVHAHLRDTRGWNATLLERLAHPDSVTFRCTALELIRDGWVIPDSLRQVS